VAGASEPCLVHCTAGKDRTGVIAALVLGLCGVDDDTVAHEYGLTDLGLRERREELVGHVSRALGLGSDAEDRVKAENMVGAKLVFLSFCFLKIIDLA
jgi:protein tyrosine/serine phosphatase